MIICWNHFEEISISHRYRVAAKCFNTRLVISNQKKLAHLHNHRSGICYDWITRIVLRMIWYRPEWGIHTINISSGQRESTISTQWELLDNIDNEKLELDQCRVCLPGWCQVSEVRIKCSLFISVCCLFCLKYGARTSTWRFPPVKLHSDRRKKWEESAACPSCGWCNWRNSSLISRSPKPLYPLGEEERGIVVVEWWGAGLRYAEVGG